MTSVPDRSRVRLPGISSRAYEHPADRSALVALRKLTGFDVLLRRLSGLFSDRALRLMFLASSVRASEQQFPHIYETLRDGAYILDLPNVPELYIWQNPMVNAMAIGTDKPFIVITTGMVNLCDAEELRFVVGHELGHVLSGHAVYRTMLFHLINLAQRIAWMPIGYLGLRAIIWGLEEWYRKSELSCDRAGLLAGQDVDAARRALMKLAGGAHMSELSPDAFHQQAHEYDAVPDVGRACSSCCSCRGRRTRSRWCGSPSWTAGPTAASTRASWPATTRAARTTARPRSAKRSSRPHGPTRSRGTVRRTRSSAWCAESPRPRPAQGNGCSAGSLAVAAMAMTIPDRVYGSPCRSH